MNHKEHWCHATSVRHCQCCANAPAHLECQSGEATRPSWRQMFLHGDANVGPPSACVSAGWMMPETDQVPQKIKLRDDTVTNKNMELRTQEDGAREPPDSIALGEVVMETPL